MELRELETFRAVVESGGMSHAALRLNRAQSSVTARIRQLETSLGVSLFERDGRRLRLTVAGDKLIGFADRLLALAEEARAAVRDDNVSGRLRLGAMESTATSRLPHPLAEFHRRYPGVSVELQTGCSRGLLEQLQAGTLDVAITSDDANDERFASTPWYVEEMVLVAAVGMKMACRRQQLAGATLLMFNSNGHDCAYHRRFEQWMQQIHAVPARVLKFASYQAILIAAAAGVGISLLPRVMLETYSQRDTLSVYEVPARVARVSTAVMTLRGRHVPGLTRLIECLREDYVEAGAQKLAKRV